MATTADWYLTTVRTRAKLAGIRAKITYAHDGHHKFKLMAPDGTIRKFGASGSMDFLLYKKAEEEGLVPDGTAEERRRLYHVRASKIKGDWRSDPFSPNALSLTLLW